MEEKIVFDQENKEEKGNSLLNLQALTTSLFLNWKWIVFSVLICLGLAQAYLRYTTPIYRVSAKMLIKEEERTRSSRNALQSATNLGTISNSTGLFNEIEIIKSHDLAEAAVRDLKLYVNYNTDGRIKNLILYGNQPINVDIDPANLDRLSSPISLAITRQGNNYHVKGSFSLPIGTEKESGPYSIDKVITKLPQTINTRAGVLSFRRNGIYSLNDGATMFVTIQSPSVAAYKYAGALTITPNNNTTTIAQISLTDENPQRAKDYLVQLINVYNRQANEDKNEIARNTEEFINSRLEKINAELGATEGALENFKKRNRIVQIDMNAGQAMGNADNYEQKLTEANTQVSLLNSISDYMNQSGTKYQTLPSNVGLTDQSTTELINKYNELVLERNRRLGSASETSPVVTSITTQLDELNGSIRRAMSQARKSMDSTQ